MYKNHMLKDSLIQLEIASNLLEEISFRVHKFQLHIYSNTAFQQLN